MQRCRRLFPGPFERQNTGWRQDALPGRQRAWVRRRCRPHPWPGDTGIVVLLAACFRAPAGKQNTSPVEVDSGRCWQALPSTQCSRGKAGELCQHWSSQGPTMRKIVDDRCLPRRSGWPLRARAKQTLTTTSATALLPARYGDPPDGRTTDLQPEDTRRFTVGNAAAAGHPL